jgi:Predicted Zn-dependent hydrolases of the beta-lactamase fold
MKIKKFPQSCILIEVDGVKILIDPGVVKFEEEFLKDWQTADAVLVTHRHRDHFNADALQKLNIPIYSTSEIKQHNPNLNIEIIKQGDEFKIGNVKIEVVKAIHGFITSEGEVFENVGYIIDDGKVRFYITSDTIRFNNNFKVDILFANITAFDASMNLWGAVQTTKDTEAKLLIVAHQDDGRMLYEKEKIEQYLIEQEVNFIIPDVWGEFEI